MFLLVKRRSTIFQEAEVTQGQKFWEWEKLHEFQKRQEATEIKQKQ